jgi:tetratricopeptide (TPR) repeat protein
VELRRVRRGERAAELHRLAELVRFRYGLAPRPSEEARALVDRGRRVWEARGLLLGPAQGGPDQSLEATIRSDLIDFLTVWADLRVRMADRGDAEAARREVLQHLDEALALLGPRPALARLRGEQAAALGLPPAPVSGTATTAPGSAWEHGDLGRAYLRAGDLARAAEEFQAAVESRPHDFWPNFYQGLCAYRRGEYDEAVAAFRVCVALAPDTAECYYNRGRAYEALGRNPAALRDYSRALQLDPALSAAALNRGILLAGEGRHTEAAADLDRALPTAGGRESRGVVHYNRALVELARGDRPAALAHLEAAVRDGHAAAGEVLERLRP